MTLRVVKEVAAFRAACDEARTRGVLGLVPTMGALHAGHLALVQRARELSQTVALTLFVNPTQFGPGEDLARYPRDLEGDLARCREAGVSLVFAPEVSEVYPAGERTRVRVSELTEGLCGASRPVHFEGVATVVTKLFAAAGPCVAVFGRKDYQQLKVVERLARDLLLPVTVVGLATVREADGLALSSRNAYLSAQERAAARGVPLGLSAAAAAFQAGERQAEALLRLARQPIEAAGLALQYAELTDADQLTPLTGAVPERALLAVAAHAGRTRLIDNLVLGEDPAPIAEAAPASASQGSPSGAVR